MMLRWQRCCIRIISHPVLINAGPESACIHLQHHCCQYRLSASVHYYTVSHTNTTLEIDRTKVVPLLKSVVPLPPPSQDKQGPQGKGDSGGGISGEGEGSVRGPEDVVKESFLF